MNPTHVRAIGAGIFFLLIVLSGFWVSNSGRPLNVLIFTIHKLIALAALIFLGITVYGIHQAAGLSRLEVTGAIVTGLFFIGLFATGALLSSDRPMPVIVLRLHQLLPFLVTASTAAMLYLLLFLRGELPKI
jgi:hypothetical protein